MMFSRGGTSVWVVTAVASMLLVAVSAINCDAPSNVVQHVNTFFIENLDSFEETGYQLLSRGACTTIRGNVRIVCDAPSLSRRITNLNFLAGITSISGYLYITNCNDLTSLSGLQTLSSIGGSANFGLYLENNSAVEDLKELENLDSIGNGGVTIRGNDNLCYADLIDWNRISSGSKSVGKLNDVLQVNVSCTSKLCADDCYCGYCGGPGSCDQLDCEEHWYDPPDWVTESTENTVGYVFIIIFATLFSFLAAFLIYGCIRKRIAITLYVFSRTPQAFGEDLLVKAKQRKGSTGSRSIKVAPAPLPSVADLQDEQIIHSADQDERVSTKDDAPRDEIATRGDGDEARPQSGVDNVESATDGAADYLIVSGSGSGDEKADSEDVESEDETIEPAPRPLKPFSNFLSKDKDAISAALNARLASEPNLTSQRVAAEMWQRDPAVQTKYKSEYEKEIQIYEDYLGKLEYRDAGKRVKEWNNLTPTEKEGYTTVGLAKEKTRRRASRRRSSQQFGIDTITSNAVPYTSEQPVVPPRPAESATKQTTPSLSEVPSTTGKTEASHSVENSKEAVITEVSHEQQNASAMASGIVSKTEPSVTKSLEENDKLDSTEAKVDQTSPANAESSPASTGPEVPPQAPIASLDVSDSDHKLQNSNDSTAELDDRNGLADASESVSEPNSSERRSEDQKSLAKSQNSAEPDPSSETGREL